MSRPGIAVFILFFGIAFLDGVRGGHWARVAFWLATGLLFWYLDRRQLPGDSHPGQG